MFFFIKKSENCQLFERLAAPSIMGTKFRAPLNPTMNEMKTAMMWFDFWLNETESESLKFFQSIFNGRKIQRNNEISLLQCQYPGFVLLLEFVF